MTWQIRDYGDRALLLECDGTDTVIALAEAVRSAGLAGVIDVVPAARTVLVTFTGPAPAAAARPALAALRVGATGAPQILRGHSPIDDVVDDVIIDVIYDGADLAAVAAHLDMDVDGVVAAHTGTPWRVAFTGFAPGFGYLVGGDPRLRVPRRAEPRSRVPAGSVALADEFSGVYPLDSPGGWQLIGRTDALLWDPGRADPALLIPGRRVRFRERRR